MCKEIEKCILDPINYFLSDSIFHFIVSDSCSHVKIFMLTNVKFI